jgi:hypothetical protein
MMASFKDSISFARAVTRQFSVETAEVALRESIQPDSMKVVVNPPRLN